MSNKKPAKPSQQFTPVADADKLKRDIDRQLALGKIRQRDIQAELEKDKQGIPPQDYRNESEEYFSQFKKSAGNE